MGAITGIVDIVARELMLFAAVGLLIGGIDDLAIDLLFLARRWWRGADRPRRVAGLPDTAARFAILVPAWREAGVIGAMLATALARYRHDDYLIFVAAYPNDRATVDAIMAVTARDPRVRLVINPRPGPTTKADNLNAAWGAVLREEAASGRRFAAAMLHDAEDMVHPDELRLCGALIGAGDERAEVVQLPVLPLVHPRSPLVSGHYIDEFAEGHGKQMVIRAALGAGMPLAGTGCAIAMPMLRTIADARGGLPFEPTSLTEDYEMGLAIAAAGGRGVFARYLDDAGQPVAVRAYFPGDFAGAARQKARWMVGIALAGWDRTGWARSGQLTDHWMRMRDRRAPLAVLVLAAAYAALLAWALSDVLHWTAGRPAPAMAPGWLLGFNLTMLGWRLAMRIAFTTRDYGWRQGLWAAPRFMIGNMVALAAAPRALAIYLPMLFGAAPVWEKTEHEFPVGATV